MVDSRTDGNQSSPTFLGFDDLGLKPHDQHKLMVDDGTKESDDVRIKVGDTTAQPFDAMISIQTRVHDGGENYNTLPVDQRQQIQFLAGLFCRWEDAYDGSKRVWEIMKADPQFDLNVLIAQIQLSFADFLVHAIRKFMTDEDFSYPSPMD
jgi:hypothetical protein